MDDRRLYQTILGLTEPWYVSEVKVHADAEEIEVLLGMPPGAPVNCPLCGQTAPRYDQAEERRWRHLDTCQYQTVLIARVPRVECVAHGVRQIAVPWAEDRSRFTALFEALAIRLLKETTVTGLAGIMGLSWDEAAGIQRRAVARGLKRRTTEPARFVGVDETSFQKRHEYVTVVADLERNAVLWVGDDRRSATLESYWRTRSVTELAAVEQVVMDMWGPYITATAEALPGGGEKIVFDRYHVVQRLNFAVDLVRRSESRQLARHGDTRLHRTRWLWLKGRARRSRAEGRTIQELTAAGLKVGRAWVIKEAILKLWDYRSPAWAARYFKKWFYWATHSRLAPVIKEARIMQRHLPGILAFLKHRITNALTESLNAKIQEIKYRARGYRNRENFRLAILFHCGQLEMDPL